MQGQSCQMQVYLLLNSANKLLLSDRCFCLKPLGTVWIIPLHQSQEQTQQIQKPEICQEQMKKLIRSVGKIWIKIRGSDMTIGLDY